MIRRDFLELRQRLAAVAGIIAPLVETAFIRRVDGGSDLALNEDALLLCAELRDGDCGKQRLGVGMERVIKQLLCRRLFHDLPKIHHGDFIREMVDHGKIVRDKNIGKVDT